MEGEKRIELCTIRAGDIKEFLGNPRKVKKKGLENLKASIEAYGNFGILVIDEQNRIIAGNQRLKVIIELYGKDYEVECKKLYGFSDAELRAINIKDNTHAGEWDLDLLASWTADIEKDLGQLSKPEVPDVEERKIEEMELLPFERYNYVMIVCRNNIDFDLLATKLGLKGKQILLGGKRAIDARAVWYDDVENILFGGKK